MCVCMCVCLHKNELVCKWFQIQYLGFESPEEMVKTETPPEPKYMK